MEITKNAAVLNAKIVEAAGFNGNLDKYADMAIESKDLQGIAYAAYALGILAQNSSEAAEAFNKVCDYVYEESDFSDEELWAFHQFID